MTNRSLSSILVKRGLHYNEALAIVAEFEKKEAPYTRILRKNDWEHLMTPLLAQIKTLASSRSKWSSDPLRCPIYDKYLRLLRATRDQIKHAQTLAVMAGQTIPDYAKANDIPQQGMVWHAWVPFELQRKVRLAFEKLALARAHNKQGKRLIPFSTHQQRTASEVRWDKLIAYLLVEVEAHGNNPAHTTYIRLVNTALDACHKRTLTDVAPVKWQHLLSDHDQQLLVKETPTL